MDERVAEMVRERVEERVGEMERRIFSKFEETNEKILEGTIYLNGCIPYLWPILMTTTENSDKHTFYYVSVMQT